MTASSHVRVVLAFTAHEPVLSTRRLIASPLGRLVRVAEALGGPVSLAVSNELAHQLRRDLPETFAELVRGVQAGVVRPLYTTAHHAPAALLQPAELVDELRLNEECVHGLLGAPPPVRKGVLVDGGVLEPRLVPTLEERGVDFVLCRAPQEREREPASQPVRVGARLVALRLSHDGGAPDRDDTVAELARLFDAASDGGVLAFVHPLSDLERVRQVWGRLREILPSRFQLVAPDQLLAEDRATPPWLPEVKLPPPVPRERLGWDGGRAVSETLSWLVEAFGFPTLPPLAAEVLFEEDYGLERLPPRAQVPMLLRLVKAGCAAILDAEDGLTQRPFLDGFRLCDALELECRLSDTRPEIARGLSVETLEALGKTAELVVDPRLVFHEVELERLHEERGELRPVAASELEQVRVARRRADEAFAGARAAYLELERARFSGRAHWRALVAGVREHLGAICIALDHLERVGRPEIAAVAAIG